MHFYSTKNKKLNISFSEALLNGLAPDGGLYMPKNIPQVSQLELDYLKGKSLQKVANFVLYKWLKDDLPQKDLAKIVDKALNFEIPIEKVGDNYIMELFHGPTMAFKDVAAGFLAQFMDYYLRKQNKKATVLVATSGDTGGAVAQGFSGLENANVIILYPKGKVSRLQEEQLTKTGKNVVALEVDGFFDDCQQFVKQAFLDEDLKKFNLTSANSINIGRLLPQIIYYFHAYCQLYDKGKIVFSIPTGNMGNITAGVLAYKMGLPIDGFIAACNANDAFYNYLQTGKYKAKKTVSTISNAMDVGNPNNFPRLEEIFSYQEAKRLIIACSVTEKDTIQAIKEVYQKENYLMDPHTAVAWAASDMLNIKQCFKCNNDNVVPVILSTASPVKFAEEINQKVGGIIISPSRDSSSMHFCTEKEKIMSLHKIPISVDYKEVKNVIQKHLQNWYNI